MNRLMTLIIHSRTMFRWRPYFILTALALGLLCASAEDAGSQSSPGWRLSWV